MSVHDQATVAILSQVALAAYGAVLGLALAYIAVCSLLKFKTTSSALNKVNKTPYVNVSDLRSVLSNPSDQDTDTTTVSDEKIVIVRGVFETKSVVNNNWKKQNVLVSHESNEKALILQRTQTAKIGPGRAISGQVRLVVDQALTGPGLGPRPASRHDSFASSGESSLEPQPAGPLVPPSAATEAPAELQIKLIECSSLVEIPRELPQLELATAFMTLETKTEVPPE